MAWYFGSLPEVSPLSWLLIGGIGGTVAAVAMAMCTGGEVLEDTKAVLEDEALESVGIDWGSGDRTVLSQFDSKTGRWTIGSQKVDHPLKADAVVVRQDKGWKAVLTSSRGGTSETVRLSFDSRKEVDEFLSRFVEGNTHYITGKLTVP